MEENKKDASSIKEGDTKMEPSKEVITAAKEDKKVAKEEGTKMKVSVDPMRGNESGITSKETKAIVNKRKLHEGGDEAHVHKKQQTMSESVTKKTDDKRKNENLAAKKKTENGTTESAALHLRHRTPKFNFNAVLNELETQSRQLEPNASTKSQWLEQVKKYTDGLLAGLPTKKAYSFPEGGQNILTDTDFGESKTMSKLIEILNQGLDQQGILYGSGRDLAFIPGGCLYPSALGDYIAAVGNYPAGMAYGSPGAVRMENKILRWLCDMVGLPKTALGNLTSGGSIANQIAIATARDTRKLKAHDFERSVVYLSAQTHHCVLKALNTVGLREAVVRKVTLDDQFRMKVDVLRNMIQTDRALGLLPFIIVASAGTTDTGVVDDLDQIADVAQEENLWFHVDGAYGGFFMLCESLKPKFKGIERSDSVVLDPHKGLFIPFGSGAVLIRDVQHLYKSQNISANYLQDAMSSNFDEVSPAYLSPELTKHFRGLRMWLPLQLFGVAVFKAALEEKVLLCRYFYEKVQEIKGIEVGPYPDLSVMIYRYVPEKGNANDANNKLIQLIKEDGRVMLSSTTIDDVVYLRLAALCFRTHREHIETCLDVIRKNIPRLFL